MHFEKQLFGVPLARWRLCARHMEVRALGACRLAQTAALRGLRVPEGNAFEQARRPNAPFGRKQAQPTTGEF
jgi:hypothetical protein